MPVSPSRWLSFLALLPLMSGCGDDLYPVTVSWVVNGLAPTADVCERYDIDRIVLTITDGARDRTIEADCTSSLFLSDGYEYGGFVTTDAFDYDVVYPYQLDMIATDGSSIIRPPHKGTFVTRRDDFIPVELPTLDLLSPLGDVAAVTGSFSVGSGDLAQACEDAGINRVELWVYSVLDSNLESPAWVWDAECASGVLDSKDPLLDFGDYQVVYAAVSYISEEDYEVVEVSEPISVYVDIAGVLDLPAVTFGR